MGIGVIYKRARLSFVSIKGVVKEDYSMIILGQFSLFLHKNKCWWYSLEAPRQATSNEYP